MAIAAAILLSAGIAFSFVSSNGQCCAPESCTKAEQSACCDKAACPIEDCPIPCCKN